MISESNEPHKAEAKWQKYWEDHHTYKVSNDDPAPNITSLKCSRILRATFIWARTELFHW